jgi:hypothetical protein
MSVQAMNPDTNAPDTPYTLNGYEAFYGTVTVDKAARTFVVTVKSSVVREHRAGPEARLPSIGERRPASGRCPARRTCSSSSAPMPRTWSGEGENIRRRITVAY